MVPKAAWPTLEALLERLPLTIIVIHHCTKIFPWMCFCTFGKTVTLTKHFAVFGRLEQNDFVCVCVCHSYEDIVLCADVKKKFVVTSPIFHIQRTAWWCCFLTKKNTPERRKHTTQTDRYSHKHYHHTHADRQTHTLHRPTDRQTDITGRQTDERTYCHICTQNFSLFIPLRAILIHTSFCMLVIHGPSQQSSKEEYKPWKWGATAR